MKTRVPRALFAGVVLAATLSAWPAAAGAASTSPPPAPPPPRVPRLVVCTGSSASPGPCRTVPLTDVALYRRSCGYISCTIYFDKAETREIAWGQGVVLTVVGGFLGGPLGAAAVQVLIHGGQDALANNACVKLKIGPQYGSPRAPFETQWYDDPDAGCR